MKLLFLLSMFFLFHNLCCQEIQHKEFIKVLNKKIQAKYKTYKNLSYTYVEEDSSNIDGKEIRVQGNTIFKRNGSKLLTYTSSSLSKLGYYSNDSSTLLLDKHKKKYFKAESLFKDKERYAFDFIRDPLFVPFTTNNLLMYTFLDSVLYVGIKDVQKKACYVVRIISKIGVDRNATYFIDTTTLLPKKISVEYTADIKEYTSTTTCYFSNFDTVSNKFDRIQLRKELKGLQLSDINELNKDKEEENKKTERTFDHLVYKPMTIVTGTNVQLNSNDTLHFVTNKTIILDFWFISCYPCAKAREILKRLELKYPHIEIIGLNAFDKLLDTKNYLKKFGITNQNLLINKELIRNLKVEAYPTLICIGKDGFVKKVLEGLEENLETQIEKFIINDSK